MNVVERTNPSGRMGKLEETEAGGEEEVKGGKREGEGRPQGGLWWKGGDLAGLGLGDAGVVSYGALCL